ncbi:hypothetical protein D6817_02765, partial [Candidatus Pacearchaeota archaeon]
MGKKEGWFLLISRFSIKKASSSMKYLSSLKSLTLFFSLLLFFAFLPAAETSNTGVCLKGSQCRDSVILAQCCGSPGDQGFDLCNSTLFFEGMSSSDLGDLCNSVYCYDYNDYSCAQLTRGHCQAIGGTEVTATECTKGCCDWGLPTGCVLVSPTTCSFLNESNAWDNLFNPSDYTFQAFLQGPISQDNCDNWCGSASARGNLTGTVVDEDSNPLFGVTVRILGLQTQTDIHGNFSFENIMNGTHEIRASKIGYNQNITTVQINDGSTTQISLTLTRNTSIGALQGSVRSTGLIPLPGATVVVMTNDGPLIGVADATGNYFINMIPPGNHTAIASAPGFIQQSRPVVIAEGFITQKDFALPSISTGNITGTVYNESSGLPVEGALVSVGVEGFDITNSTGGYLVSGVSEGNMTVKVTKPFFNVLMETVTISSRDLLIKDFNLTPSGTQNTCVDGTPFDSCSLGLKPAYCNGTTGDLEPNWCYGLDMIVGTSDDCGCPFGTYCVFDGSCQPSTPVECTSRCTYTYGGYDDFTCHADCNGTAGCSFYDSTAMNNCDNQPEGSSQTYNS